MKPDEFGEALRELDREFESRGIPADVDARLRSRLERPTRAIPWIPVFGAVAAAAAIAFVVVVVTMRPPEAVAGLEVQASNGFAADVEADRVVVKQGTATLNDARGVRLLVGPGVEFSRSSKGATVRRGRIQFEVAVLTNQVAGYSVTVSHGVIEVIGSSFVVQQDEASGSVRSIDGSVRFRSSDGRVVEVAPNETLRWPLPAVEAVAPVEVPVEKPHVVQRVPVPVQPKPVVPVDLPAAPFSSDAVLARVAALRSRRSYEEAVQVLSAALNEAPTAATRERLGFELGSLLTHQLHDVSRACSFWAAFRQEHPKGRYDQEVEETVAALKCGE